MAANVQPIYSKLGDIQYSQTLLTAANDYSGLSAFNSLLYKADATNGGYIQRIRFKALGTNVATVARVFLNPGTAHLASLVGTPGAPSGTPATTGGTMLTGSYFAKIVAVDSSGALSVVGTESSSVSVTGPTGSIAWSWTAVTGASSYRIYVGTASNGENAFFTSVTNSYSQTTPVEVGSTDGLPTSTNNVFYDEVALPATTATATTATVSIDLPMNMALPPGWEIYVGLATTVAAGWQASTVGGKY